MWWRVGLAVLVAVVCAVGAWLWWVMQAPMFTPGTVAQRVAARGESLDPAREDPAPDRWAVTADVGLFHDSFGQGREVVYVHGGPGYPPMEPPAWLTGLGDAYRVHAYHARGCGRSTRPLTRAPEGNRGAQLRAVEDALGLAEQLADLERVRRRLGAERLVLVGHSFGALVAALYAAEFPERVQGLVLLAPAPLMVMPKPGPDLFALLRERLPEGRRAAYDEFVGGALDLGAAMGADEGELSRRYGALRDFYAEAVGGPRVANEGDVGGLLTVATYLSLGRRHDWRPALSRVTARTVVLHGAGDLQPEADTRAFAEGIGGAEVRVVSGADHFGIGPREVREAVDAVVR